MRALVDGFADVLVVVLVGVEVEVEVEAADLGGVMGMCRYLGDLPGGRRGGKRVGLRGEVEGEAVVVVVGGGGWMGRVVDVDIVAVIVEGWP